jgi:acetyl-CoA carboxylase biotin carboxyl carrier protein
VRRAGRLHAPELEALVERLSDPGVIELRAPRPGVFVPWIEHGDLVTPGAAIGALVVLGRTIAVVAPRAARATGIARKLATASRAVGYGDTLVALDTTLQPASLAAAPQPAVAPTALGLVFRAPTSGRFYGRSAPDKPPFVTEGTELVHGATIGLLEVMKTFHRVTYGGAGLPDAARVVRVLVADGDDVNLGDPLLALE